MNSNKLKLIACISMFIDHLGYLVFPQFVWLRYIGRLAMPIFAFSIAEGCRHTKNKFRYFSSLMILAVLCEAVYLLQQYSSGGITSIQLNVLFTLALSVPLASLYLGIEAGKKGASLFFTLYLALLIGLTYLFNNSAEILGLSITLDYGIAGILLCFMPILCKEKGRRLAAFSVGVLVYCLLIRGSLPYIWYSLLSIPLIALYNGKRGSKKFKYAFYLFYPLHLAAIYGLDLLLQRV